MIPLLLALMMSGIAVGGEIAGTVMNNTAVSNKTAVQNPLKPADNVKIPIAAKGAAIQDTVIIPDVIGLPHGEAVSVLLRNGLDEDQREPAISGDDCIDNKGNVVFQEPAAGTRVQRHSSVKLGWCR